MSYTSQMYVPKIEAKNDDHLLNRFMNSVKSYTYPYTNPLHVSSYSISSISVGGYRSRMKSHIKQKTQKTQKTQKKHRKERKERKIKTYRTI